MRVCQALKGDTGYLKYCENYLVEEGILKPMSDESNGGASSNAAKSETPRSNAKPLEIKDKGSPADVDHEDGSAVFGEDEPDFDPEDPLTKYKTKHTTGTRVGMVMWQLA